MKKFENLGQILNKAQQKKIIGGYCWGTIQCSINGNWADCGNTDMVDCLDACESTAAGMGATCDGCAQFPC